MKRVLLAIGLTALLSSPLLAASSLSKSPPGGDYQAVSMLVKLPDFLPGMGQLFVNPKTLPAGPFLAYDHEGKLVSTIYMIPLDALQNQQKFEDLAAPGGKVDHVDVYYNAGHPGVEKPHAHIVLWHVSKSDEALVAK